MFEKIRDAVRRRRARRFGRNLYEHFRLSPLCSDYENMFAQVRPLINEMKKVFPYAVGKNGQPIPYGRAPELDLLKYPNDEDGWAIFADLMFATWLTEDELDIYAWHNERGQIDGYTVLPPSARHRLADGSLEWRFRVEDDEVVVLEDAVMRIRYSRSPTDPEHGISPATATRIWAQIDDLIAQYQKAYFENGAVPATITFITASTKEQYESARAELEANLTGAKNRNKTVFAWRQIDNRSGDTQDAIEVKTIQGNNSTLAIKDIVSIINDRLNKSVGVSNFLMGDDSSAKYDNAELSRYQFMSNVVVPALISFWNQFQHELDRITGGLGYGIDFEVTLPELTEREKVRAETNKIRVESLVNLINAGATADGAVKALGLSEEWRGAASGVMVKATSERTPDLMELRSAPITEAETVKKKDIVKHTCNHTLDELPPMTAEEKKIYDLLVMLADSIAQGSEEVRAQAIIDQMTAILQEDANAGALEGAEGLRLLANKDIAGQILDEITNGDIVISERLDKNLAARADELVRNFEQHTREVVNEALAVEGTANELAERLAEVMPTNRAETIARNETLYAIRSGRLEQDERLAEKYGLKVSLVWRTSGDSRVCPVCAAMEGTRVPLGEAFPDSAVTEDGERVIWEQSRWNDDGRIPDAHVNCRCYFDEVLD